MRQNGVVIINTRGKVMNTQLKQYIEIYDKRLAKQYRMQRLDSQARLSLTDGCGPRGGGGGTRTRTQWDRTA